MDSSIYSLNGRAVALIQQGCYQEASALLQQAIQSIPDLEVLLDGDDDDEAEEEEDCVMMKEYDRDDFLNILSFHIQVAPACVVRSVPSLRQKQHAFSVAAPAPSFCLYDKTFVFVPKDYCWLQQQQQRRPLYHNGVVAKGNDENKILLQTEADHHFLVALLLYNQGLCLHLQAVADHHAYLYSNDQHRQLYTDCCSMASLLEASIDCYNQCCGILTDYILEGSPQEVNLIEFAAYNNMGHAYCLLSDKKGHSPLDFVGRIEMLLEEMTIEPPVLHYHHRSPVPPVPVPSELRPFVRNLNRGANTTATRLSPAA